MKGQMRFSFDRFRVTLNSSETSNHSSRNFVTEEMHKKILFVKKHIVLISLNEFESFEIINVNSLITLLSREKKAIIFPLDL